MNDHVYKCDGIHIPQDVIDAAGLLEEGWDYEPKLDTLTRAETPDDVHLVTAVIGGAGIDGCLLLTICVGSKAVNSAIIPVNGQHVQYVFTQARKAIEPLCESFKALAGFHH